MTHPDPLGRTTWVFPGGFLPPRSTGDEPERTSRDELCVLNTGTQDAQVELTVFYEHEDPVGPYPFTVAGRRVRHVRVNDLVDPLPVPLGLAYGVVLHASRPVVAQLTRVDSRDGLSTAMAAGFPVQG